LALTPTIVWLGIKYAPIYVFNYEITHFDGDL
jgi:hypothetical protein